MFRRNPNVTRGISYARSMPLDPPERSNTTALATGSEGTVGDDEEQATFLGIGEEISQSGTFLSEGSAGGEKEGDSVDAKLNDSTSEQAGVGVRFETLSVGDGINI